MSIYVIYIYEYIHTSKHTNIHTIQGSIEIVPIDIKSNTIRDIG